MTAADLEKHCLVESCWDLGFQTVYVPESCKTERENNLSFHSHTRGHASAKVSL